MDRMRVTISHEMTPKGADIMHRYFTMTRNMSRGGIFVELADEYDDSSGLMTISGTVIDANNLEYAYDAVEAAFSTAEDLAQAS